jgi:hypothetical protein
MEINNNNKINSNELHPCQYCGNTCKGKQCRECHLKMVEKKQGTCINCNSKFYALRIDGTKRQRCFDCQNVYNTKHISSCPICKKDYHAFLDDGRIFSKCYNCYQNSLVECKKCFKKNSNNQPLCKKCYQEEKINNKHKLLSIDTDSSCGLKDDNDIDDFIDVEYENTFKTLERSCRNKNCFNMTRYTFCKDCYIRNKKELEYISVCDICGYKGKGNFKICNDCKE